MGKSSLSQALHTYFSTSFTQGNDPSFTPKKYVDSNTLPGSPIYLNDTHFNKDGDNHLFHLWDFAGKDSMVINIL